MNTPPTLSSVLPNILRAPPSLVFPVLVATAAQAADAPTNMRDIELRRLLDPTPSELSEEESGRIYIYDGLHDIDIDRAMREHFHRVEYMMFIRTKKTDASGAPKRDAKTGAAIVEDDGC